MTKAKFNNTRCLAVLRNTIKAEPTDWKTIVDVVGAEMVVTNWLTQTRSVLQFMLNEGEIKRVGEPHVEQYVAC